MSLTLRKTKNNVFSFCTNNKTLPACRSAKTGMLLGKPNRRASNTVAANTLATNENEVRKWLAIVEKSRGIFSIQSLFDLETGTFLPEEEVRTELESYSVPSASTAALQHEWEKDSRDLQRKIDTTEGPTRCGSLFVTMLDLQRAVGDMFDRLDEDEKSRHRYLWHVFVESDGTLRTDLKDTCIALSIVTRDRTRGGDWPSDLAQNQEAELGRVDKRRLRIFYATSDNVVARELFPVMLTTRNIIVSLGRRLISMSKRFQRAREWILKAQGLQDQIERMMHQIKARRQDARLTHQEIQKIQARILESPENLDSEAVVDDIGTRITTQIHQLQQAQQEVEGLGVGECKRKSGDIRSIQNVMAEALKAETEVRIRVRQELQEIERNLAASQSQATMFERDPPGERSRRYKINHEHLLLEIKRLGHLFTDKKQELARLDARVEGMFATGLLVLLNPDGSLRKDLEHVCLALRLVGANRWFPFDFPADEFPDLRPFWTPHAKEFTMRDCEHLAAADIAGWYVVTGEFATAGVGGSPVVSNKENLFEVLPKPHVSAITTSLCRAFLERIFSHRMPPTEFEHRYQDLKERVGGKPWAIGPRRTAEDIITTELMLVSARDGRHYLVFVNLADTFPALGNLARERVMFRADAEDDLGIKAALVSLGVEQGAEQMVGK